jgi:hypothetical protein
MTTSKFSISGILYLPNDLVGEKYTGDGSIMPEDARLMLNRITLIRPWRTMCPQRDFTSPSPTPSTVPIIQRVEGDSAISSAAIG